MLSLLANVIQFLMAARMDRRRLIAESVAADASSELASQKRAALRLQTEQSGLRAQLEEATRRLVIVEERVKFRLLEE